MKVIGIRREDKIALERRVPIIPSHIKILENEMNIKTVLESSNNRIFSDERYAEMGAEIVDSVDNCDIIFGVKEIPIERIQEDKTYIFFPHVVKGQRRNMEMLKTLREKRCTLIDYECITDDNGHRLLFFSKFAGYAGMIDTLWSMGQRYQKLGIETPFLDLKQAWEYNSLDEARRDLTILGHKIARDGLPKELGPVVIGFAGYGNVYSGASEMLDFLPVKKIRVPELMELEQSEILANNIIYKVVFREEHMVSNRERYPFDLEEYKNFPDRYESKFEQYLPYLSVLVNCINWSDRYPRLVTLNYLRENYNANSKLKVIGDLACDVHGAIECTAAATTSDNPVYVYNPAENTMTYGSDGEGLLIMSVGILPSELPRESSIFFSNALLHYIPSIVNADYSDSYEDIELPSDIKRAIILKKGELSPLYSYLENRINLK
ncbi:MAG: hypothetical protein JXR48_02710 [Candidatus Delongbacteria bacterium]|nr:hypothetical protein [Candidatus Delongbacteria bacterium]MBN2833858.1 hypothetical protein [Candidatus Delongbacteria bacterium]